MDKSQFGTAYFENIIRQILMGIGEDPDRDGLLETPKRVVKSWTELFSGYTKNVEDVFKVFEADGQDEMVVLRDSEIFSNCEHHMQPFFGKVHIAYIPNGKVIGISKLARLADIYAHRLQIQERLTKQITDALMKYLKPKGAACVVEAQHLCMKMRGVNKQNSVMLTSSLTGCFKQPEVRSEFFRLIGK